MRVEDGVYHYTSEEVAAHVKLRRAIDVAVAKERAEAAAKKQAWANFVNDVHALLVAELIGGDHPWYSAAHRVRR